MSELPGNELSVLAQLRDWIEEREGIRLRKEAGQPKPWSKDPVFQTTYFCNVHREDDKVTKWIRYRYASPAVPYFDVNLAFARFINWPDTLECMPWISPDSVGELRNFLARKPGKIFGDAYIISTNGRKMGKAVYLCEYVVPELLHCLGSGGLQTRECSAAHEALVRIFGVASFMSGQIIGDMKNTKGHPLYDAIDKRTFAVPGPGSLRGLSWIFRNSPDKPIARLFVAELVRVRDGLYNKLHCAVQMDNQDLQNCLCEFDKYMRVTNGTGRSKRRYPGT